MSIGETIRNLTTGVAAAAAAINATANPPGLAADTNPTSVVELAQNQAPQERINPIPDPISQALAKPRPNTKPDQVPPPPQQIDTLNQAKTLVVGLNEIETYLKSDQIKNSKQLLSALEQVAKTQGYDMGYAQGLNDYNLIREIVRKIDREVDYPLETEIDETNYSRTRNTAEEATQAAEEAFMAGAKGSVSALNAVAKFDLAMEEAAAMIPVYQLPQKGSLTARMRSLVEALTQELAPITYGTDNLPKSVAKGPRFIAATNTTDPYGEVIELVGKGLPGAIGATLVTAHKAMSSLPRLSYDDRGKLLNDGNNIKIFGLLAKVVKAYIPTIQMILDREARSENAPAPVDQEAPVFVAPVEPKNKQDNNNGPLFSPLLIPQQ
ncbi:MAG: hypothetical protein O3C63_00045 [Cyanobacteria bacterium]|nr:hypothetical protein [Cyanobacteriota bacterium]